MSGVTTREVRPDEAGMRLDRWFKTHYPDLAFGHLNKLLRTGQVRVSGARAKAETRIEPGQVIRIPPLERVEVIAPPPGIREVGARRARLPARRPRGPRLKARCRCGVAAG